jgi:UrcA family protein
MTTQTFGAVVGVVAVVSLFASATAFAEKPPVNVAIHVDTKGLDLTREEGARKLYLRIKDAAWVACTHGDRVGLEPLDDPQKCADQSLAVAIRSVPLPALAQIYLETHTLQQAAVMGISVPMAAATKLMTTH